MAHLLIMPLLSAPLMVSAAAAFSVPHFTRTDGAPFVFPAQLGSYCLVTDKKVQLNALMGGYQNRETKTLRTWMKGVGLLWVDEHGLGHKLYLLARSEKSQLRKSGFISFARLDSHPIALPDQPGYSLVRGDLIVTYVGTTQSGFLSTEKYRVRLAGLLDMTLTLRPAQPALQTTVDSQIHFNIAIHFVSATDVIHGVIGQSLRKEPKGSKGSFEGSVKDYRTTWVLNTDCLVSQYEQ